MSKTPKKQKAQPPKKRGRNADKENKREKYYSTIKNELNPNGKEDFDTVLKELLQTKGDAGV